MVAADSLCHLHTGVVHILELNVPLPKGILKVPSIRTPPLCGPYNIYDLFKRHSRTASQI